jgi:hypothetical protein
MNLSANPNAFCDQDRQHNPHRELGLPPTEPRSQFQLSPVVPVPWELPLYSARSQWEFKTFISGMQGYFDLCGNYCKETRKIEFGRDNLLRVLLGKWDDYAARLTRRPGSQPMLFS